MLQHEAEILEPTSLMSLRAHRWAGIPSSPGVYWWYFPAVALDALKVVDFCDLTQLNLRVSTDGKVCLYHGVANNLAERLKWHSAQALALTQLRSRFLSTFRFTLLALNDFDYLKGASQIDAYFNSLSVRWQTFSSRTEAHAKEVDELKSSYHYPLNIQGNKHAELASFIRHLKASRKAYRCRYI